MKEVSQEFCGAIPIPGICKCVPDGTIGASVECSVGIPLSGGLTIGAGAHFLPCGSPASMGYKAWIADWVLAEKTWTAEFQLNLPLPAPPAGFNLGVMALKTRAELQGVVSGGKIEASVAFGVCGSVRFVGECCNTECPLMGEAPLPYPVLEGSYDFSHLC
jgi:hypothetical protein